MTAPLDRFVEAQRDSYPRALSELRAGRKMSHWMWYVFPQIAGLGHSETARFFAIADRGEAAAFLAHPLLGARLEESVAAIMRWASGDGAARRDIVTILGEVDAQKFRSSMTLFEAAGESSGTTSFCSAPIAAFYHGARDERTLALLGRPPT